MRIKNKIKLIFKQIFEEMSVVEYILWWMARGLMIYAIINFDDNAERILCMANALAMFALPFFRFIFPTESIIGKLSFRCQHLINIMVLAGSFVGNYLFIYNYYPRYDRFLHCISGPVSVFAGYFIVKALTSVKGKKPLPPSITAYVSGGFSFAVIALWEIMEFGGDFFFGTENQCFRTIPSERDWFFRYFGPGAVSEGRQFPLWDTIMDMIDASATTVLAAIVLLIVLIIIDKRTKKTATISAV